MSQHTNENHNDDKEDAKKKIEAITGGLFGLFVLTSLDGVFLLSSWNLGEAGQVIPFLLALGVCIWAIVYHSTSPLAERPKHLFLKINGSLFALMIVLLVVQINNQPSYPLTVAEQNALALEGLQAASDAKDAKCRAHPEWC